MKWTTIRGLLFLWLITFSCVNTNGQAALSVVQGHVREQSYGAIEAPIKIILKNFYYSDTTTIEKGHNVFMFRSVPYGIYTLEIDANHGETGLKNFVVENVLINAKDVVLDTIHLFATTTCGDGFFMLGKKDTVEYYPDGSIYAKGYFDIKKRHGNKSSRDLYRKNGLWKYFYQNGQIKEYSYYNRGVLKHVMAFYSNGNVKYAGSYKVCRDGEWVYYNSDGTLLFKVNFFNESNHAPTMKIQYDYLDNYSHNCNVIQP